MQDCIKKIFNIVLLSILAVFLIAVGLNAIVVIIVGLVIIGIPVLIYFGIFCLLNDGKGCKDERRFTRDEPVVWYDYDYDN